MQYSGKIIFNLLATFELLGLLVLRYRTGVPSHVLTFLVCKYLIATSLTEGIMQDEKCVMNNEKAQALGINDSC